MQKAERLALGTFRGILEPHGLTVALDTHARHPRLAVDAPDGWSRRVPMACSGRSDDRCQANYARQKANGILRDFIAWGKGAA